MRTEQEIKDKIQVLNGKAKRYGRKSADTDDMQERVAWSNRMHTVQDQRKILEWVLNEE